MLRKGRVFLSTFRLPSCRDVSAQGLPCGVVAALRALTAPAATKAWRRDRPGARGMAPTPPPRAPRTPDPPALSASRRRERRRGKWGRAQSRACAYVRVARIATRTRLTLHDTPQALSMDLRCKLYLFLSSHLEHLHPIHTSNTRMYVQYAV